MGEPWSGMVRGQATKARRLHRAEQQLAEAKRALKAACLDGTATGADFERVARLKAAVKRRRSWQVARWGETP